MPRASQMPRTRAVRTVRSIVYVGGLALLAAAGAVAKGVGESWLVALGLLAAFAAVVVLSLRLIISVVDRALPAAYAKDLAALTAEDRALPFGVVAGADEVLLLPSKTSTSVMAWVVALGLLAGGVAVALVDDPVARGLGVAMALLGAWTAVLAFWITGTRIRLTRDGVESRMRPRLFYAWLEVPELKIDRQLVILKAAGARRPRLWIRVGLLEVSVSDCVAMIHRQRGW